MIKKNRKEIYRAERISFLIEECNDMLSELYEELVDRDFDTARKVSENVIREMKFIIKSMKEDDF